MTMPTTPMASTICARSSAYAPQDAGLCRRATSETLALRFGYLFETPPGSTYPPILDLRPMAGRQPLDDRGSRRRHQALPFAVEHGPGYESLGFRFGDLAYLPDVSLMPLRPRRRWPVSTS
jgi:ribosomal protein L40E